MFTINGSLRLAEYTQLDHHVFQVKDKYVVNRIKREEKELVICEASNTVTKEKLDIMKFTNVFVNNYGLSILRQVQIYKAMRKHKYIRSLLDIMIPTRLIYPGEKKEEESVAVGQEIDFKDVYLVFQSMEDFEHLLAEKEMLVEKNKVPVATYHKSYLWQILTAVHHLHLASIVHGNINPHNLAVSFDRKLLQLYNFHSSARQVYIGELHHDEEEESHQPLLAYTPPEFLLGYTRYHPSADIWAVGCIFAQLLNRGISVLSLPPHIPPSKESQLLHIIKMVRPTSEDKECLKSDLVDQNMMFHLSSNIEEDEDNHHPLDQLTLDDDESSHLLKGMLHFNPSKRLSAEEALNHNYFVLAADNNHNDDREQALLDIYDKGGLKNKIKALAASYRLEEEGIAPYDLKEGQLKQLIWKEMKTFDA